VRLLEIEGRNLCVTKRHLLMMRTGGYTARRVAQQEKCEEVLLTFFTSR
jgi:hypothetical protein